MLAQLADAGVVRLQFGQAVVDERQQREQQRQVVLRVGVIGNLCVIISEVFGLLITFR